MSRPASHDPKGGGLTAPVLRAICSLGAMTTLWLGIAAGTPANGMAINKTAAPPPTAANSMEASAPPAPARVSGSDAAATFAYELEGVSRLEDHHRYLKLPEDDVGFPKDDAPSRRCAVPPIRHGEEQPERPYAYRTICLQIRMKRPEVLAGRTTRLTLLWSAYRKRLTQIEVQLAANGHRIYDWLRASGDGGDRRMALEIPAVDVRRLGGLNILIVIARRTEETSPKSGKSATVDQHYIDGLELELLP